MSALECPYRFKLHSVDGIKIKQNSIHTVYGTIMHQIIQGHLQSSERDESVAAKRFKRTWRKFSGLYRKHLEFDKVKQYLLAGLNVLKHVNEAFEPYNFIASEQELMTPVRPGIDVQFKGFIDLLLESEGHTVIADMKTALTLDKFKSYLKPIKRYQVLYYQKYFSQQFDMPEDEIDMLYIVLEKDPKSKKPIKFMSVSFGAHQKNIAEGYIDKVLEMADTGDFKKNREACYNSWTGIRCPFFETEHCT